MVDIEQLRKLLADVPGRSMTVELHPDDGFSVIDDRGMCIATTSLLSEARCIAALHNAAPALLDELEDLRLYRDLVESGKGHVNALLRRGEQAEAELEAAPETIARLTAANTGLVDTIRKLDPVALCDWHDGLGGDIALKIWLAERDRCMKTEGVAEWLKAEIKEAEKYFAPMISVAYMKEVLDVFRERAK